MEIYTEVTSEATRDALKRLGDELSLPDATAEPHTSPEAEGSIEPSAE
jgi:hypothetical protein